MKNFLFLVVFLIGGLGFAQEKNDAELKAERNAVNLVYSGNELLDGEDVIAAEMEYRKAISEQSTNVAGTYNLGNTYYNSGHFEEALFRHQQAAKKAKTKTEKHMAFHNIGNILMKSEKCKEAAEAFKNALRNDPTDDESRYNYVIAKKCAEEQEKENEKDKKDDQENKDENKDKDDQEEKQDQEDKKDQNEDKGDQDKQDGEDQKDDEGKPKEDKSDEGKGDDQKKDKKKPKPQPGQLSPQQVKNLLEAMNNQEQKVQEKINAEKQKGVKIKTEKDW
ncbi:MAG: aerotolerance regulator BatC [Bacteroidetes bacterium MedPE-SWsnd-G2]|nr:MAG: aerotolerance regulator BatC [Bacteroidetes bacterium MedPE-SWsnd-G2]